MSRARVLYLHGFASGPRSQKAVLVRERLEREAIPALVPDLNVPDFEHLRPRLAIERAAELARGGPLVVVGSSLGGLMALHVAARLPAETRALVLLCPALAPGDRWAAALGPDALEAWRRDGTRRFHNFVTNDERPVDFGFFEDLVALGRTPPPAVPTRVIHGRRDETVPVALSEALAKACPALVQLEVVDDDHSLLAHGEVIVRRVLEAVALASRPPADDRAPASTL